jgi:uncharacterized membrane protein YciS (DUF1049 family)
MMFAAMSQGDAQFMAILVVGSIIGFIVLWLFYMLTFRTKDFMELMKAEQERRKLAQQEREAEEVRKAKRDERVGKTIGTVASVAKMFWK